MPTLSAACSAISHSDSLGSGRAFKVCPSSICQSVREREKEREKERGIKRLRKKEREIKIDRERKRYIDR